MTSSASTAAFRVLAAATFAAAVFLDLSLAHARATGRVPVKPAAGCDTAAPAAPTPPPTAEPAAPPGIVAAFGSCGAGGPPPATPPIRK